ncbi:hypothetical protein VMCG_02413 [Cytospora schulzeri]|uniref:Uncharacterized protein n=1 Tax=Cytospora schulzeri TaxID=448051 RepID=A0A423X1U7_9PEZI|nr:hypothetical protein VMCG_02413 [Valsa malicola]
MSHSVKPRKSKSQGQHASAQPTNAPPPPAESQSEMLQRWEIESQKNNLPYTEWRWYPQDPKAKDAKEKY